MNYQLPQYGYSLGEWLEDMRGRLWKGIVGYGRQLQSVVNEKLRLTVKDAYPIF
jgi:hypothetical protein